MSNGCGNFEDLINQEFQKLGINDESLRERFSNQIKSAIEKDFLVSNKSNFPRVDFGEASEELKELDCVE